LHELVLITRVQTLFPSVAQKEVGKAIRKIFMLMSTDLESLLKIVMFFQKRTKVDDYLRCGYPQV